MSGQNVVDTFFVTRDSVRDNLLVTTKLRLPKGATIRSRRQYATAAIASNTATVNMPYNGCLVLNVTGSAASNTVVINNPFVTAATPVSVSNAAGAASVAVTNPGQITLTLTAGTEGSYTVCAGFKSD